VVDVESPTSFDDTLDDFKTRAQFKPSVGSKLSMIGNIVFATAERLLVFAGFAQVLTGIVVYTGEPLCTHGNKAVLKFMSGGCRGHHINICAAHLISMFSDRLQTEQLSDTTQRAASSGVMAS
jgi:hypothetical protein